MLAERIVTRGVVDPGINTVSNEAYLVLGYWEIFERRFGQHW